MDTIGFLNDRDILTAQKETTFLLVKTDLICGSGQCIMGFDAVIVQREIYIN